MIRQIELIGGLICLGEGDDMVIIQLSDIMYISMVSEFRSRISLRGVEAISIELDRSMRELAEDLSKG